MAIKVLHVGEPWKATPTSDPMWMITVEGMGEPQKTYDAALSTPGEYDAESYESKAGKTYWRLKGSKSSYKGAGGAKVFKADPDKMKMAWTIETARNQSIQRQVALKLALEQNQVDKANDIEEQFDRFMKLLVTPWQPVPQDTVTEAGDFAKINDMDIAFDENGEPF